MFTIFFIGKSYLISSYLSNLNREEFSVKFFSSLEEGLRNIRNFNPHLIIISTEQKEEDLFDFCKIIREKFSLVLRILLIVDFYSSFNLDQFRNFGVDFIIRPFTQQELYAKIESFITKPQTTLQHSYKQQSDDIIDKLRPYIKQEVRLQMQNILKQILDSMEQRHV